MRRLSLPLAVVMLAALPATALADVRFRGKSAQGRLATLRTADTGLVERFGIRWAADCARPRFIFLSSTKHLPPYDGSTPARFVDADGYRDRLANGSRAVFHSRVVGNRVSARRWRGTFRVRVRVFRGSRLIDRCFLRTRWRVLLRG